MMNLADFKEFVNSIPEEWDEATVFVAQDEEGNGFSPFGGFGYEFFYDYSDGEISFWHEPDAKYEEDYPTQEECERALVIWP